MAKSLLKVKGKKTKRSSKSETYLVNWKYLGDEPKNVSSKIDFIRAFNWYNNMIELDEARQYIKDYFKADKNIIKQVDRIPDKFFPLTSAWLCRIATNSNRQLTNLESERVINDINNNAIQTEDKPKVEHSYDKPSIQERVRERVSEIIGDVEVLLDKEERVNMYEWLQKNEIPAAHSKKIAEYYKPLCEEYAYAISVDNEGYERFTKTELKVKLGYLVKLVEDCERFAGNVKKARAPRKKKAPTAEKLLKHFQYQKESNEYKLQSCDPATILGAQELWTFNTKYKTLGVYRARGPNGLSIRRTAIDGFDSDTSMIKRVGRKPEEYIKKVLSGGKIVLRKLMEEINTDPATFSDRINPNTILLRVVK